MVATDLPRAQLAEVSSLRAAHRKREYHDSLILPLPFLQFPARKLNFVTGLLQGQAHSQGWVPTAGSRLSSAVRNCTKRKRACARVCVCACVPGHPRHTRARPKADLEIATLPTQDQLSSLTRKKHTHMPPFTDNMQIFGSKATKHTDYL